MVNLGGTVSNGLRRLRASVRRDGADRSGLSSLMELSFVNAAGDALVTVALAGSLFFAVPSGEARSKVAMYLLITMVPFALLAPVIGPLLDRVAYGRRTALAAICLGRGLLAWQLAGALDSLAVYPLALGLLVLSRGFGVARSAVIPRVAPPELTLVKVNSRISLVNIAAGSIVAPVGLGIANIPFIGYPWVLRICALVYMAGVLLAFNLPGHVDSAAGELPLRGPLATGGRRGLGARFRAFLGVLPVALRATLVLRGLVGFLTFYLAFLLRTNGGNNLWLGGLAICAGAGSGLGVFIGGRLGRRRPEGILMLALLLAAGGCLGAAITYTKFTSLLAALLATMAGSMGKLALDAIVQRDIPESTRNSAFARSETVLQLSWVGGGAFGLIEMPGTVGFAVAAILVGIMLFVEARALRRSRLAARARRGTEAAVPQPADPEPGYVESAHAGPGYPEPGYAESGYAQPTAGKFTYPDPVPYPDPAAAPVPPAPPTQSAGAWAGDPDATNPLGFPAVPTAAAPAAPPAPPQPPAPAPAPAQPSTPPAPSAAPLPRTLPPIQPSAPPPVVPHPSAAPSPTHATTSAAQPPAQPWGPAPPPIPKTLEDPTRPDQEPSRGGRWRRRRG